MKRTLKTPVKIAILLIVVVGFLALVSGCEGYRESTGDVRNIVPNDLFFAADKIAEATDRNTAAITAQTEAIVAHSKILTQLLYPTGN